MRVFLTGATGFIGSAIVRDLLEAGHEVLGLARSDSAAAALASNGVAVQRGALDDLERLREGAAAADGVIHTAFIHDFSDMANSGRTDLRAIEAIGEALAGSDKPFVVTSGIALLEPGEVRTEDDQPYAGSGASHRMASDQATLTLADRGVRASLIRLPPSVHGEGDKGFVPQLITVARANGVAAYVGDGSNRWPAVHRLDAARLFRLAVESAPAGATLHGVAEEGIPMREIAQTIGRHLGVPAVSIEPGQAAAQLGWIGHFSAIDTPASSALTRERMGWNPTQATLLEDVDQGHYFRS